MSKGPVLIDLADQPAPEVVAAAPVPDLVGADGTAGLGDGQAMQVAARLGARKPSRLARWFWALVGLFLGAAVSLAAWDFATSLIARVPVLGWLVAAIGAAALCLALMMAVRELAGLARLRQVDGLQARAHAAAQAHEMGQARAIVDQLLRLYRDREDLAWGKDRLRQQRDAVLDADGLLELAERELMTPLDQAAQREVEAAARQVATVTALVPLALADVVAALTANLRMIRRVAEIYGGRAGTLGSWRLFRAVMTHLVATGAVAAGDDLVGTLAGGGVLAKLSRRFGEGIVNGALTARVGVAAMEVCRPLPFGAVQRPSVTGLVKRALTGLFAKDG